MGQPALVQHLRTAGNGKRCDVLIDGSQAIVDRYNGYVTMLVRAVDVSSPWCASCMKDFRVSSRVNPHCKLLGFAVEMAPES